MKSTVELKAELKRLGGETKGNLSQKTLIERIEVLNKAAPVVEAGVVSEYGQTPPVTRVINVLAQTETPAPAKPVQFGACSEDQVLIAVDHNLGRGMTATFKDNCWTFKSGKREDSGTMCQSLSSIVKCANLVCQGTVTADRLKLS